MSETVSMLVGSAVTILVMGVLAWVIVRYGLKSVFRNTTTRQRRVAEAALVSTWCIVPAVLQYAGLGLLGNIWVLIASLSMIQAVILLATTKLSPVKCVIVAFMLAWIGWGVMWTVYILFIIAILAAYYP